MAEIAFYPLNDDVSTIWRDTVPQALRDAADNWDESGGDPNSRVARTMRAAATRLEKNA